MSKSFKYKTCFVSACRRSTFKTTEKFPCHKNQLREKSGLILLNVVMSQASGIIIVAQDHPNKIHTLYFILLT